MNRFILWIDAFNFRPLLDRSFRKLSSGETRKVLLIRAFTSRPDLLVLDEPFEGLDIESYEFLATLLGEFASHVRMVLVLNRFDEIPGFVTHVAYMDAGRLEHRIERSDEAALADLEQLLHLQTTDLAVPPPDTRPKRPSLGPGDPLVRLTGARIAYGDSGGRGARVACPDR